MGRRSEKTKELFSQNDTAESVDFEIAFAALLATLSPTYPHTVYPVASQAAAFAVLTITLLRRMAVLSNFIDNENETRKDWLMEWSIPFVEFASVSAILLLFVRLYTSFQLEGLFAVLFWIGTILLVLLFAAVQELLFRDEMLWWYQKFIDRYERNPDLEFWLYLSARAWMLSRAPMADNASGRFRYGPPTGEDEFSLRNVLKHLGRGFLLFILGGGVLFGLGFWALGWVGVAVVYTVLLVRDQIRFWYAAYGNGTFDQMAGPLYRTYLMVIFYLGAIVITI